MRYILAIVLPPVAVLTCGKPVQALLNLLLTVCLLWVGGVVHALLVVNDYHEDKRAKKIIEAMQEARFAVTHRARFATA